MNKLQIGIIAAISVLTTFILTIGLPVMLSDSEKSDAIVDIVNEISESLEEASQPNNNTSDNKDKKTPKDESKTKDTPPPKKDRDIVDYVAPQFKDCPDGTTLQLDGTCLKITVKNQDRPVKNETKTVIKDCSVNTIKQSDGTCLKQTVINQDPKVIEPAFKTIARSGVGAAAGVIVGDLPTGKYVFKYDIPPREDFVIVSLTDSVGDDCIFDIGPKTEFYIGGYNSSCDGKNLTISIGNFLNENTSWTITISKI